MLAYSSIVAVFELSWIYTKSTLHYITTTDKLYNYLQWLIIGLKINNLDSIYVANLHDIYKSNVIVIDLATTLWLSDLLHWHDPAAVPAVLS